jgi:ureidoacrylate peracid hydrolase
MVISAVVLERLTNKRGRRHPFAAIDCSRTAHLVVDMQSAFLSPGAPLEIPSTRGIVNSINRISRALRSKGGLIVYLQHTVDDSDLSDWSVYYHAIVSARRRSMLSESLRTGSSGHAIWHGLDVQAQDWLVQKHRFGAFMSNSSDLHSRLQAQNIDTVIISGTATNCCCESTARESMALNYRTFVVGDATATDTDDEHNASLSMLLNTFADVRTTRSMTALIRKSPDNVVHRNTLAVVR